MKAREQLNWLLESGGWNVDDSAAALRELDGLIKDFADHYSMTECQDNCAHCRNLRFKARQAGYGEK